MDLGPEKTRELIAAVAEVLIGHADELTALDSAIGDGDHGQNMKRGMNAVLSELDAIVEKPIGEALKAAGLQLVMKVGGASGPLYGTLFMALGKELGAGAVGAMSRAELAKGFIAAIDAVKARGKSDVGQKTMLDVLAPVASALADGKSATEIALIAEIAKDATRDMEAKKGRASFLGERSIGHIDPGARSSQLMIGAVAEVLGKSE